MDHSMVHIKRRRLKVRLSWMDQGRIMLMLNDYARLCVSIVRIISSPCSASR
jgi:hypothetical protein